MFVDTSAWVALAVEGDKFHVAAKTLLDGLRPGAPLVTTDYVFDETVTRVRRLAGHRAAVRVGDLLRASAIAQIVAIEPDDVERAWQIFQKRHDQELSFTDCTSVAILERLRMRDVFAFDDDFRRLGFNMKPGKK